MTRFGGAALIESTRSSGVEKGAPGIVDYSS